MDLDLHVFRFDWAGGDDHIGPGLADLARRAETLGVKTLSVMDHFFQMDWMAPASDPMLEGYSALAFVAGNTRTLRLRTLVTGVTYRHPGVLAKTVTTVDVLSGGRAELGIGAAWYDREHAGLGVPFPPTAERFERLEEALQICLQMWSDSESSFAGQHYTLGRTLNSPQSVQRPHPPILIGGSGEKKTLKLVARYAQACNLFPGPELTHKLEVLQEHCETEGRDYAEIEKTVVFPFHVGRDGERVEETLAGLRELADLGVDVAHGRVEGLPDLAPLQIIGEHIVPAVADW